MKKAVICLLLFLFVAFVGKAQTGVITTVVGNGYPVDTGNSGPATAAGICRYRVSSPDKYGNYYIAERLCNVIRRISATGIITHFAGNGSAGYSGDNGPATAAMLNDPGCLTLDDSGNLYISENAGSRIRKIDAVSSIITTIAGNGTFVDSGDGGPATAAAIGGAAVTCFDENGNMYLATASNFVRRINATTHIITTIAGTGYAGHTGDGGPATAARISASGICLDGLGNLYIADGNTRVRKVEIATGIISTIAGDDTALYSGDGIPATAARLNPFQITSDRNNNLFVTDHANQRIREITSSGFIYTIAGMGMAGFSGDGYSATSAKINYPESIVVDGCGNIMFNDNNNVRIRKVTFPAANAPTINITAATGNNLCYGMPVTFTAHTTLAGSAPVYQWKVNGTNVGTSAPTYVYTPANGDSVQCVLTSNLYCVINPMDTSNTLHMSVGSYTAPTVAVAGDTMKGVGATVNLNATIIGATGSYILHWKNHGIEFAATAVPAATYTKGAGTDSITVGFASSGRGCYDSAVSNIHVVWNASAGTTSPRPSPKERVVLYPNPVVSSLTIEGAKGCEVRIYNLVGQRVMNNYLKTAKESLNLEGLVRGIYLVEIVDVVTGERVIKRLEVSSK